MCVNEALPIVVLYPAAPDTFVRYATTVILWILRSSSLSFFFFLHPCSVNTVSVPAIEPYVFPKTISRKPHTCTPCTSRSFRQTPAYRADRHHYSYTKCLIRHNRAALVSSCGWALPCSTAS
jgi:hypothetical protein